MIWAVAQVSQQSVSQSGVMSSLSIITLRTLSVGKAVAAALVSGIQFVRVIGIGSLHSLYIT
jgi:hypothetical protein